MCTRLLLPFRWLPVPPGVLEPPPCAPFVYSPGKERSTPLGPRLVLGDLRRVSVRPPKGVSGTTSPRSGVGLERLTAPPPRLTQPHTPPLRLDVWFGV